MGKRIIITCGGTGGHLAPGIALAEGLTARGHQIILFISQKKVDARLIEKYPHFNFVPVPGAGFSWHPLGLGRFVVSQVRGFVFSLRAMRQMRPDVIVGFGGFTSVSAVIAGRMLRIPVALHEANRVPGRTVCLLGRLVQRVYLPQGVRLSSVRASATRHVSLPVRREISRQPRAAAQERLELDPRQKVLVVFGGSQGAGALNDWARSQLDRLAHAGVQVYCVTGLGKGRHEILQLSTQTYAPIRAVFTPFCDDVAGLLSAADLVVARAGAGTMAELIRCTTPAILVPYPYAASDHQRANAAFFEKQGGGVVVDQMFISTLHAEVLDVIFNDWLLNKFRTNLARMDHAASFDLLLDDLTGLIGPSAAEKNPPANHPSAIQPHVA
ncbi:MAG TPA: UDP-N-acetylglucosamine--N-acetylmuramyl-(pentapeptide) pyrophosphoryl-undecaprenol N-acetylglucosamine transferase [Opitutaceae bacterium]|jgi:UDP-N-acetylglucosamine--N-acetylmuramyl-(pentapeptide) pyrophosphoryl-undecaprenol N-acetylglucosamine transferase|nr:UDP-N-acetylglucosamine--N-acetylmuramyl-(pentapeptide) pyrophosphoryl-undecaprenol N-acetylglucosamine transferase [Opitutaceae bacterium]